VTLRASHLVCTVGTEPDPPKHVNASVLLVEGRPPCRPRYFGRILKAPLRAGGFSLIEVLVVLSILAVAIATVGACLGAGMRVWEVAHTYGRAENEALMAMNQLSRDLRNAVNCGTLEVGGTPLTFAGEAEQVRFAAVVTRTDLPDSELALVRYLWHGGDQQLVRETTVFPDGQPRTESWAEHVRGVRFSYGAGSGDDAMDVATGMPTRVEIELQMDTGSADGAWLVVRRTVQMPTAQAVAGSGE
jgi:prepilin-type N-terminal cleavage/methylation domain-containing protein